MEGCGHEPHLPVAAGGRIMSDLMTVGRESRERAVLSATPGGAEGAIKLRRTGLRWRGLTSAATRLVELAEVWMGSGYP